MNGLKIVIGSGDEKQAKLARAIAPVRKNGNLLLCTLLFGNSTLFNDVVCELSIEASSTLILNPHCYIYIFFKAMYL
jgi:hypothetical protein